MQHTLADFPPSDLYAPPSHVRSDWVAAGVATCAASDLEERMRFNDLVDLLDTVDPYGSSWAVLLWPHSAREVAWVQEVFVRPESAAAAATEDYVGLYQRA